MRACIIDPSTTFQHVLGIKLSVLGIEVAGFASGREALEHIDPKEIDLVIAALVLEDMSGPDFCKTLREKGVKGIPVIMLTSTECERLQITGMKSGITEIFQKSNLNGLIDYLSHFVEQNRIAREVVGHVLYVEDSRTFAAQTQKQLNNLGLTVDHFAEAKPALDAFAQQDYDLVLTDVILGGEMSGIVLAREIRNFDGARKRIPILAMSGLEDVARKVELLRSGVNDYIAKPVIEEEFAARVRNLIENKKLMDQVEEQQKRLMEMATTDQLTGLLNRRHLQEFIPRLTSEARRHKIPLSIIVMDLDHFKQVNDTHGHSTGDCVLVDAAKILKESCRQEDFVVRFGGEEFVLVLPHCNGKNATLRAEALRIKIEQGRLVGLYISASFGVTELPLESDSNFDDLFNKADQALYQAKEEGRNRVIFKSSTE
jgi:diguanylate cyclase (GGDEF)-like protein